MLKNFIYFILYLSLIGMGGKSWAQENTDCSATFSLETGELSLPCVTILGNGQEGQQYQVEMQQVASQEDFHFIVTQTQEVSHPELSQKEIPFSVVYEGTYSNRKSEYLSGSFLTIRNETRFDSLWQELFPDYISYPRPEKPVIDFGQETVIAVFLGHFRDIDGIRVKISKIIEKKEQFKEQFRYHTVVLLAITARSPDSFDSYAELSDGAIFPFQLISVRGGLRQPIVVNTSLKYYSSWPPEEERDKKVNTMK